MRIMNKISAKLTQSKALPWRIRYQGGPLNTIFQRPKRQKRLESFIKSVTTVKDDITVVYGIRNRVDYKFWHSLNSIRVQNYVPNLINILVVDYGSIESDLTMIRKFCAQFDAKLLETNKDGDWNRAHCLNIGIKRVNTKYLLTTDTDIIFSDNYISELIETLKQDPLSVIFSKCLDLKESANKFLIANFESNQAIDSKELKSQAEGRSSGEANAGINASFTQFYKDINGYDEYFKLWGSEDNDIKRRLEYYGLESRSIASKAYYLHQWHPKHEGVNASLELKKTIEENHRYFKNDHRIFKNTDDWGEY
ncbi:MAG: putative glycosyltransferase involved in capsule biosynthesis [Paraglaciecola sp.]|jgi:predicted glycosyltransferase involved in capsule biosynthesis